MNRIPGSEMILERSANVRKVSSLKENGTISEAGRYTVDVRYEGTGVLSSSGLRALRMLFSYKATDSEAHHVEEKICEQSPHAHHVFDVQAGQPVRWTLEVKSGSLAKGLPVRVTIQRASSDPDGAYSEESVSPRVGVAPSGDSRLGLLSEVHDTPEYGDKEYSTTPPDHYTPPSDDGSADESRLSASEDEGHEEGEVTFANAPPPDPEAEIASRGREVAEDDFGEWTEIDEEEDGEEAVVEEEPEDIEASVSTSDVVWKEQVSIKRGRDAERSTPLLAGFYRLILHKTDNLAGPHRIISSTLSLTRQADGSLIKQHTREVGGFKNGKKLIVDFSVKATDAPAVFTLYAETNAKARIVPVKMTALIVYRGENEPVPEESLKSHSKRPLKRLAENRSKATTMESAGLGAGPKKDKSLVLLEVKSVDVLGTKKWDLTLNEGYYYLGVVNVSQAPSGGERKTVTGKLKLTRSDNVEITTMESAPLPQDSLPWKAYFHVSSAQSPAKLHISVTSHIKGIATGVRTSLKVKKLPNPYSYDEIKRKTEIIRHITVAALAALLLLSYSMQFIQWVFFLQLPLIGISIRMICTVLAGIYGFQHREELVEFLRVKMAEGQENLKWLMDLDDSDHSIQKLKLLRERQNKKREEKRIRLQKLREL